VFLRFERRHRRLFITLVANRRVGPKVLQTRLGSLGSSAWPVSLPERVKFWAEVNQRFLALRARHPDRISEVDEERIRAAINERVPRPREARQNRQSVERNGESVMTLA
jgi:hypothetical protein